MGTSKSKSKSKQFPVSDGDVFPLNELPSELRAEIFIHVPAVDLLKNCSLVNKTWKALIDSQKLWKAKCDRKGVLPPEIPLHALRVDFKILYFHNPYIQNLIKNPCANEQMKYWTIDDEGDKFRIEDNPIGSDPVENYTPVPGSVKCWATSYRWCKKTQTVDLIKAGCSTEILDVLQPDIQVSEWYAARFDCGIKYKLKVQLLGKENNVIDEFIYEDTKPAGRDWFQAAHTFTHYGPGLRYIRYTHKGKDTQFWAGHYGAKFTLSSVHINLMSKADNIAELYCT